MEKFPGRKAKERRVGKDLLAGKNQKLGYFLLLVGGSL